MSFSHNFIDHTADIAVEVEADTIEELFLASAEAFKEAVIENDFRSECENYKLVLDSHSLETLLVNFLNELNFRLIIERKIFNNISEIKVHQVGVNWYFECVLKESGVIEEKIKTEIKSVTYHQMEIKKENGKYSTRIVFDI